MAYYAREDDPHFQRLTEAVEWSHRQQKDSRYVHQFIVRHLLGEYHPTVFEKDDAFPTSVPLLSMAYRAMARHLISKAPRVLVTSEDPELHSWMEDGEIAVNRIIQQSNLTNELRECVNQAMASFGIFFMAPMFVGTADAMKLDLIMQAIDRADFIYDTRSSSLEMADFQGHEFDMTVVDVHENPMFDPMCRTHVQGNDDAGPRDEQTNRRREREPHQSLYDYVRIRCVYERRRNKLYYYPRHQPELKLLETEWLGPRHGPYRFLYFEKPPGQAEPLSPLMHLLKKHRAFNILDVKTIHQQQASKGCMFYSSAQKEEAKAVADAPDNSTVLQENGPIRWGHVGGASTDTVAMAEKQKRDFSYSASGIIDQFMAQADTLGQERLLRGASNEFIDDMADYAYQFVKGVAEDVYWFHLRDPNPQPMVIRKKIEGTDLSYATQWTPQHRQIALEMEHKVDVAPYSYVERSPQSRLADLLGALQIMLGLGDQMMAQGITLDCEAVFRTVAKYKNLPELYDWFILNQDPMRLHQLLGGGQASQPVDTAKPNGRYTRESRSDGSGVDMELMRMFGRSGQQSMAVA